MAYEDAGILGADGEPRLGAAVRRHALAQLLGELAEVFCRCAVRSQIGSPGEMGAPGSV